MKRLFLLLECLALLGPLPAFAQYIWIDCSFKAVLNPNNGQRYYSFDEADLDATIKEINQWLGNYQRGYRFRRVGPIQDVGGQGDCTGPSKWYDVDLRANAWSSSCGGTWSNAWDNFTQMQLEARYSNSVAYAWKTNAINFYVVAGYGPVQYDTNNQPIGQAAGNGAYATNDGWMVSLGSVHSAAVLLHETGHHFELFHTQGGCGCIKSTGLPDEHCNISTNGYLVGDDDIADTLPTQPGDYCFTSPDQLALANFNKTYAACTDVEKNLVDDTYLNLMSYGFHPGMIRLTPLQLDKWTQYANSARRGEVSGFTRYVSTTGNNTNTGLFNSVPKRTVLNAVNASNPGGGDIVLLRPGNYNEHITISNRVTLRAAPTNSFAAYPRWATIGQ